MHCNLGADNNGQEATESLSDEESSVECSDLDFISE